MGVDESLPALDPAFKRIVRTSAGVTRSQIIGQGWKVLRNYSTSLAGAAKWVDIASGGVTLTGSSGSPLRQSVSFGDQDSFPAKADAPGIGFVQMNFILGKLMGNFFLPEDVLKIDKLDSTTTQVVSLNIKGTAKRVALQHAIAFYLEANSYLHTMTGLTISENSVIYTPSGGRIRHMYNGLSVDVYNPTGPAKRNGTTVLLVDGVDYVNKTVRLVCPDGTNISTLNITGNDQVYIADCYSASKTGPYGPNDWIKASSTLFHSSSGLSVSAGYYEQFKSIVAALSAALTEANLTQYIGAFFDAYGFWLDTIITTRGVTQKYIEQPTFAQGSFIYDRQGQPLKFVGGWAEASYVYEGRDFDWLISPFQASGVLHILKLGGGDIKRFVPPALPQAGSDQVFPQDIEFFAPVGGHRDIFKPVHDTSGATVPMVEAPFIARSQIIPDTLQGIKLTSVTESTSVATTSTTTTTTSTGA